jgi:hypothetical protein
MNTNRAHFVTLTANGYTMVDDVNANNANDDPSILQASLKYPIAWLNITDGLMSYDGRGIPSVTLGTIYVNAPSSAAVDCVAISTTRVTIGKYDSGGGNCVQQ